MEEKTKMILLNVLFPGLGLLYLGNGTNKKNLVNSGIASIIAVVLLDIFAAAMILIGLPLMMFLIGFIMVPVGILAALVHPGLIVVTSIMGSKEF